MRTLINIPAATPGLSGEVWASLIVMGVLLIFCFAVFIASFRVDPLKKPRGLMFVAETFVSFVDGTVKENMGPQFLRLAPYIGFLMAYIFCSFFFGMLGFPNPLTFFMIPLLLALVTFLLIHITSAIYTKWRYFKRYIDPIPIFLPMNLISALSPLLSLSLRLFANALSGWVMMYMIYSALEGLSSMLFGGLPYFIAPFITPFLHLYFDLFSGFIQTLVFVLLTMLFISSEVPDPEEELVTAAVIR